MDFSQQNIKSQSGSSKIHHFSGLQSTAAFSPRSQASNFNLLSNFQDGVSRIHQANHPMINFLINEQHTAHFVQSPNTTTSTIYSQMINAQTPNLIENQSSAHQRQLSHFDTAVDSTHSNIIKKSKFPKSKTHMAKQIEIIKTKEIGIQSDDLVSGNFNLKMDSQTDQIYTICELEAQNQEYIREITTLQEINDFQSEQIKLRDIEISKLHLEKQQLEEEKSLLKHQITIISQKAKDAMAYSGNLATMCSQLQKKLSDQSLKERETLKQLDILLDKTRKSTDFAVDARQQIENLQKQVENLNGQLASEQEKNFNLKALFNQKFGDNKMFHDQEGQIKTLKNEVNHLRGGLSITKHQNSNLKHKTMEYEELMKAQQLTYEAQINMQLCLDSHRQPSFSRNTRIDQQNSNNEHNIVYKSQSSTTNEDSKLI